LNPPRKRHPNLVSDDSLNVIVMIAFWKRIPDYLKENKSTLTKMIIRLTYPMFSLKE